jgi:hypothetical protein
LRKKIRKTIPDDQLAELLKEKAIPLQEEPLLKYREQLDIPCIEEKNIKLLISKLYRRISNKKNLSKKLRILKGFRLLLYFRSSPSPLESLERIFYFSS